MSDTYPEPADGVASGGKASPKGNLPILVGDQNSRVRQLIEIALADLGSKPVGVSSGKNLLDHARRGAHRLLFLRLDLPDIDGLEVVRRLREAGDPAPAILHHGVLRPTGVLSALRLGVIGILERPFSLSQIRRFVVRRFSRGRPGPAEQAIRLAEQGRFLPAATQLERAGAEPRDFVSVTWISLLRGIAERADDSQLLPLVHRLMSPTSGLRYPAGTRFNPSPTMP